MIRKRYAFIGRPILNNASSSSPHSIRSKEDRHSCESVSEWVVQKIKHARKDWFVLILQKNRQWLIWLSLTRRSRHHQHLHHAASCCLGSSKILQCQNHLSSKNHVEYHCLKKDLTGCSVTTRSVIGNSGLVGCWFWIVAVFAVQVASWTESWLEKNQLEILSNIVMRFWEERLIGC